MMRKLIACNCVVVALFVSYSFEVQGVSSAPLQEPKDCTAFAKTKSTERLMRVASLADFDAFLINVTDPKESSYQYPEVAAQYDLSRTCCPNNSYIVEWEVVLKTFKAPAPFDDGQYRSLNGTVLPRNISNYFGYSFKNTGYIDYRSWNSSYLLNWDGIQGIALTTLHNKTLLGSIQAKCGVANGTIVAVLPKIGGNLTSDCLNASGLTVLESQPIRLINSSLPTGIFTDFFVDNHFKLPKDLTSNTMSSLSDWVSFSRSQDSPYQDFMGLMKLMNLTATTSPATVDVAKLDWSKTSVEWGVYSSSAAEGYRPIIFESAATGFTGLAGCFGPMEMQVFADRLYLDSDSVPDQPASYAGCSYDPSNAQTYGLIGIPTDRQIYEVNRFKTKPLVCCPDREYVKKLELQFRGDSGFSNPDYDGVFRKRLCKGIHTSQYVLYQCPKTSLVGYLPGKFTGICSGGTRLPEVSAGSGCTGFGALLEAFNTTVQIPYGNMESSQKTKIEFGYDAAGILGFMGVGPNSTLKGGSSIYLGGDNFHDYNVQPAGKRLRIVGLDATATCNGIASLGMVLRTRDQVNEPGTLSAGAIAGIVVGAVAFIAILVVAGNTAMKRRKKALMERENGDKASMIGAS